MSQDTATIELSVRDMGDFDAQKNERASIIIYGPEGVEVVHLSSPHETVVVGRAHPSDICISDPSLSRQHARFRWSDDELTVTDLESQNGVWIGKKRVKNALLSSGEQIRLGGISIIVAIKADPHHSRHSAFEKNAGGKSFIVLNPKMKELYREVERAALVDANVLILGETGTGKDHVAQSIHALGRLRDKRFVTVNCGAIHRELLDSQLFGYEKGAFTGAAKSNPGFFEEAQGGVLFLDEIGELSLSAQAALLRAVETKTITRLGSTKEIEVNVRIVAATHCRLEAMTREGTFREDLYFRLNTIVFELPPLRERIDEIQPLSELFLKSACEAWGQPPKRLHPAV
ncbi:MAG: sigma-54-dependent Fis family transcriptional regulator, partial [Deltaproteobacteria bacterium]|nr:sigma-54-dependent Fis family transcriptional regulator [Deltaproteobacteria bacterium]